MEYNALSELMSYYYFEFFVQCALVMIMLINTIKSIKHYFVEKQTVITSGDKNANYKRADLIISFFVLIGLYCAMMFQGVLSDISKEISQIWFSKVLGLFIFAIVLFVVQIIVSLLSVKRHVTN